MVDTMADVRRENVTPFSWLGIPSWRCEPGQAKQPIGCDRHGARHWYCRVCRGWYGVPHNDIHTGPAAHPQRDLARARDCVCRPCQHFVANYPTVDLGDPGYQGTHRQG